MDPVLKVRQKFKSRKFPLFTRSLNLLFILSIHNEHSLWNKLTAEADSHNLAFQQMSLCAFEMWIGTDNFIKITCKIVLDSSCCIDLIWCHNRKLFPIAI